jgi:hypothetical protein
MSSLSQLVLEQYPVPMPTFALTNQNLRRFYSCLIWFRVVYKNSHEMAANVHLMSIQDTRILYSILMQDTRLENRWSDSSTNALTSETCKIYYQPPV